MISFTHTDLVLLLIAIGVILIFSRLVSELGRRFKLPAVIGEILLGILLGPSILGKIFPGFTSALFPRIGAEQIAFEGLTSISVIMLLFVAGLEVQIATVLKQGKVALYTSVSSMFIPFLFGVGAVYLFPAWFNFKPQDRLVYMLFFGTAMAISALPVVTRILMDLNLFKTKVGNLIVTAAIFDDLTGWLVFSLILSLLNKGSDASNVWSTIGLILLFGLFMLVIGKRIIDRTLPWIQKKMAWPGGVLSLCLGFCFLAAAFTEKIGLHAILGAFIMGVAFGDSVHFSEKAREIIHQFVTNIFAPLFFVSIGLRVDFVNNFDWVLVTVVLSIAIICKVMGASLGARLGGLSWRESFAIGFGLNARGAMGILLGTLALNEGLIDQKMFVAVVIMALVTSIISGPMMNYLVNDKGEKEG